MFEKGAFTLASRATNLAYKVVPLCAASCQCILWSCDQLGTNMCRHESQAAKAIESWG